MVKSVSFLTALLNSGRPCNCCRIFMTESTGWVFLFWWRSLEVFPVIFRIVRTTTLIKRKTAKPFAVILRRLKISEVSTIDASKKLKKSVRNIPEEANVFNAISIKKNVKKIESMNANMISSSFKVSANTRPNNTNTVYIDITIRLNVSTIYVSSIFKIHAWNLGIATSVFIFFCSTSNHSFSFYLRNPKRFTITIYTNPRVTQLFNWSITIATVKVMKIRLTRPLLMVTSAYHTDKQMTTPNAKMNPH